MKVNWKTSEARKTLLNDLGSGFIPLNPKDMSAREALGPTIIEFNQFSRNLNNYRKKMASDPKFVWENTCVKDIVLNDLKTGRLPVCEKDMSAQAAWHSLYSRRDEFKNLPFWHFQERLRELRFQKHEQLLSDMLQDMRLSGGTIKIFG
eukprot:CAMPEP_0113650794 /NCGR_PEP_ID=MMETSP0017_2-20120614/27052_1 /TAXON_ID=2856 /ORGANISM="Cylindrotheca closterium" /LENGTH=148 /DNA_ID=CAMNT_0000563377 /DNA_START=270 /DNA_END=715 /DNA_ORIENTATION=+ /assembly_acc=CAM_ASM_000147